MIERSVSDRLKKSAEKYPVITLMGPRQSGKTTVARAVFPNHQYINLENLDLREAATEDPRGFLSKLRENVILDEIQKASDLVSYLQQLVDEDDRPGRFILTGSENLTISNTVSQSLAGRTSIFKLLPLTIKELFPKGSNAEIDEVMFRGFYPRIHAKKLDPTEALASYCETYIQKDVRTLLNVRDLSAFTRFLKLCAAHTGQLLDMTSLGNACGLDQKTIRSWLSILEASFIIYLLPPFYRNIKKRLVKSPKLYFFDVGLACYLIGIRDTGQLANHPLRGALFECVVISDILKSRLHAGLSDNLCFYRDYKGVEIDLVFDNVSSIEAMEIKSSETFRGETANPLLRFQEEFPETKKLSLLYAGNSTFSFKSVEVIPWADISKI